MTDEFNNAPRLGDRLDTLPKEARAWSRVPRKSLYFRLASLGLSEQSELRDSIGGGVRTRQGIVESVAFSFVRHGIFLEHGVGRGRPIGSAKARALAQPWLKPVLPDAIEDLAVLLADEYADIIASEVRLLIPGIIDTTVKK